MTTSPSSGSASTPNRRSGWGGPEWQHEMRSGTRLLDRSEIRFPGAPGGELVLTAEPMVTNFVSVGTGYGIDEDWRHGMWQGPELVVQGLSWKVDEVSGLAQYGIVDSVGRFEYDGNVGYGLYEHGFFGPFPKLDLHDRGDVHP